MVVLLITGCSSSGARSGFSFETKVKHAEVALRRDRIFEARRWAAEALEMKPRHPQAETLMAKVIEQEMVREWSFQPNEIPEEVPSSRKSLQIKTWLERSRGFLEVGEFDEALQAAERVFQLDPENPEASRLVDEIQEKAREEGREEDRILQEVYQQEIDARIQRYTQQAEADIRERRWGAARFAIEKLLTLDPKNAKGRKLLAILEKKGSGV